MFASHFFFICRALADMLPAALPVREDVFEIFPRAVQCCTAAMRDSKVKQRPWIRNTATSKNQITPPFFSCYLRHCVADTD